MSVIRLGDLLVRNGVITQDQLDAALAHQRAHGGRLGTCLVELGFVDETRVARALSEQFHIPAATATQIIRINPQVLTYLHGPDAERLRAIPMREDGGKLWVALAEPTDQRTLDELAKLTKKPVRAMVAPESAIQAGLERHYKAKRQRRNLDLRDVGAEEHPMPSAVKLAGSMPRAEESPAYQMFEPVADQLDSLATYLDEAPPARPAPPPQVATRPRLGIPELAAQFGAAAKDEQILEVAMKYVGQDAQRVAVFLLRQGVLEGWRGTNVDVTLLTRTRVPMADLPLVSQAIATGETFVGELSPAYLPGIAPVLGFTRAVLGLILPIRIGQRGTGIVVGVEATLDALRRREEYNKVAQKLDYALHISYLRRMLFS